MSSAKKAAVKKPAVKKAGDLTLEQVKNMARKAHVPMSVKGKPLKKDQLYRKVVAAKKSGTAKKDLSSLTMPELRPLALKHEIKLSNKAGEKKKKAQLVSALKKKGVGC